MEESRDSSRSPRILLAIGSTQVYNVDRDCPLLFVFAVSVPCPWALSLSLSSLSPVVSPRLPLCPSVPAAFRFDVPFLGVDLDVFASVAASAVSYLHSRFIRCLFCHLHCWLSLWSPFVSLLLSHRLPPLCLSFF